MQHSVQDDRENAITLLFNHTFWILAKIRSRLEKLTEGHGVKGHDCGLVSWVADSPPCTSLQFSTAATQPHSFPVVVIIARDGERLEMVHEEVSCHPCPS